MGISVFSRLARGIQCRSQAFSAGDHKPDGRVQPKSMDRINADLAKDDVYGPTDQKQITAWLARRNHAAHGEWDKYTLEQINTMDQGVTDFLLRITE